MSDQDEELELFRSGVSCAVVLEKMGRGWKLDRKQSTRRALKYRCGAGNILIINHEGRGWWDPQSTAKGDVFDLVQYLNPGLNFRQVRQVLRRFVGVAPRLTTALLPRVTPRCQPPHPHWTKLSRSRPRTDAGPHVAQLLAAPVTSTYLTQHDRDAASERPSQPLSPRCCDDQVKPPNLFRVAVSTASSSIMLVGEGPPSSMMPNANRMRSSRQRCTTWQRLEVPWNPS
jgi:hypothetical protein